MAIDPTKKKAKANQYIAERYDRLSIALPKGKREQYGSMAKRRGQSLTGLIVSLLEAELEKEESADE